MQDCATGGSSKDSREPLVAKKESSDRLFVPCNVANSVVQKALNEVESRVGYNIIPEVRSELVKTMQTIIGNLEITVRGNQLTHKGVAKTIESNRTIKQELSKAFRRSHTSKRLFAKHDDRSEAA